MKKTFVGDLNRELHDRMSLLVNDYLTKERCIESSLLQFSLVDLMLRMAIAHKLMLVHRSKIRDLDRYWNDSNARFFDLINTAELLGIGSESNIINALRDYNKQRNNIVHKMLSFESLEELNNLAKENTITGIVAEQKILALMSQEACVCGSGKVYNECGKLNTKEHQQLIGKPT